MKNYKDPATNTLFSYESDGSQDFYIKPGLVEITDAEADYIRNPPLSLAQIKTDQITLLSAACKSQIYGGFTSLALGDVYRYPSSDKDQSNLAGSVLESLYPNLPAGWTTVFWCVDSNGVWDLRPHTASQIQQVGQDAKDAITLAITKNATLAKQVMASTTDTIAKVQAIVW